MIRRRVMIFYTRTWPWPVGIGIGVNIGGSIGPGAAPGNSADDRWRDRPGSQVEGGAKTTAGVYTGA